MGRPQQRFSIHWFYFRKGDKVYVQVNFRWSKKIRSKKSFLSFPNMPTHKIKSVFLTFSQITNSMSRRVFKGPMAPTVSGSTIQTHWFYERTRQEQTDEVPSENVLFFPKTPEAKCSLKQTWRNLFSFEDSSCGQ